MSSRSNVLYRVSAGHTFLEKYDSGCHLPSICCFRTAPTALSDASDMIHIGANGFGCDRSVVVARASLISTKAVVAVSFQQFAVATSWYGQEAVERL